MLKLKTDPDAISRRMFAGDPSGVCPGPACARFEIRPPPALLGKEPQADHHGLKPGADPEDFVGAQEAIVQVEVQLRPDVVVGLEFKAAGINRTVAEMIPRVVGAKIVLAQQTLIVRRS